MRSRYAALVLLVAAHVVDVGFLSGVTWKMKLTNWEFIPVDGSEIRLNT